ncbi:MAG: TlyA family RNA methyltransferase [Tissierellia bacterium]|nr:TlyA family RNA methyltransferase [Tissierellia bacterium]
MGIRADLLLTQRGLAPSREKAKAMILAGEAFVGDERIQKAGQELPEDAELSVKSRSLRYVSRGGFKLEALIEGYNLDLSDAVCADIGASTGGFTDCMLQHGAKQVYAIDVGYNQLDYRLRQDPRVVVMERMNIRHFDPETLEAPVDFISIDVSFISLKLVLPVAREMLKSQGLMGVLIKPQFEAGRELVGKGGIVRDPKVHREVLNSVLNFAREQGLHLRGLTVSPIQGTHGNTEFVALLEKDAPQGGVELEGAIEDALGKAREEFD